MFNPFAHLTEGLRAVPLIESARVAEEEADAIRRGQEMLVASHQLASPRLDYLRRADALEKAAVILKILSLDEPASRSFLEKLKVLNA